MIISNDFVLGEWCQELLTLFYDNQLEFVEVLLNHRSLTNSVADVRYVDWGFNDAYSTANLPKTLSHFIRELAFLLQPLHLEKYEDRRKFWLIKFEGRPGF